MRACWLKWVGRDWSISADYIWLNYSDANKVTNPTLNVPPGCVSSIPMAKEIDDAASIVTLARQCVDFSKLDWDSFETSWGFKRNPLV